MKKKSFACGVLCGALLCGAVPSAFAAAVSKTMTVVYDDIKIYVNGERIEPKDANGRPVEPFVSDGTTYLPVRAAAEALGQEVFWDGSTKSVHIGARPSSLPPRTEDAPSGANENAVKVPNDGERRFKPNAGDKILCDDGTLYEIRDMSMYEHSGFTADGKRFPDGLPEPACDWSAYPELPLPDVQVKRITGTDRFGHAYDSLSVLNLYEMRRVQYTLYNNIYPESVRYFRENPGVLDGIRKLGGNATVEAQLGQVRFDNLPHPEAQGFYPYDENEVTKQVKSTPGSMFCIEVWDRYDDGVYSYTEYKLQMRQRESIR
jgi:hypothetical protein